MAVQKTTLLLIGSPRGKRSNSRSIGEYFLNQLNDLGWETREVHINKIIRTQEGKQHLYDLVNATDTIVLTFPLYVDALPAAVTEAFEYLAFRRKNDESSSQQKFVAMGNCGFPEADHLQVAMQICEHFCEAVGFSWLGGLRCGMGEMLGGAPLDMVGGRGKNTRKALEMAAQAVDRGEAIPADALDLMAKRQIPKWLYCLLGNWRWKRQAKKHGTLQDLDAQPYKR